MDQSFLAHDADGQLINAVDFNYSEIESGFEDADNDELRQLTPEEIERTMKMFRVLLRWTFQNGMKNPQGITIRAIIICWVFLPELQPLKLTDMATAFGKHKQSLGRYVDQFKRHFGYIGRSMRPLDK